MLLTYVMTKESEEERERLDTNIRAMVFAADPERYYEIFEKEDEKEREKIEREVEWLEPSDIDDIEEILNELKYGTKPALKS